MAQLRHDYKAFQALNTEVLLIVPNGAKMIERHVTRHDTPHPILTDKGSEVAERYGLRTKGIPIVRMTIMKPSMLLVNKTGTIIYTNFSESYIRQPDNNEPLSMLAEGDEHITELA